MGVSKDNGTPKSSIFIGFSLIFTIHFGCVLPIFGNIPIAGSQHPNFQKTDPSKPWWDQNGRGPPVDPQGIHMDLLPV